MVVLYQDRAFSDTLDVLKERRGRCKQSHSGVCGVCVCLCVREREREREWIRFLEMDLFLPTLGRGDVQRCDDHTWSRPVAGVPGLIPPGPHPRRHPLPHPPDPLPLFFLCLSLSLSLPLSLTLSLSLSLYIYIFIYP